MSFEHVGKALEGYLCDRSRAHARCEGSRTAGTAIYPKKLCQLIHAGLDAHERAAGAPSLACMRGLTSRPEVAVEVGSHVARSVVEHFVGRDKVSLGDPPSPKVIEPSVGRDGDVDIEDPCCHLTDAGNRNPLTLSSAAVSVCEPGASHRNPLILSSAAATVCDLASNQSLEDVTDKLKIKHKEASVSGTPSIGPNIEDPCWQLFCLEH